MCKRHGCENGHESRGNQEGIWLDLLVSALLIKRSACRWSPLVTNSSYNVDNRGSSSGTPVTLCRVSTISGCSICRKCFMHSLIISFCRYYNMKSLLASSQNTLYLLIDNAFTVLNNSRQGFTILGSLIPVNLMCHMEKLKLGPHDCNGRTFM